MKKQTIAFYIFPYGLLLVFSLISKELVIINQELFIIIAFFIVFFQLKKISLAIFEDLVKERQNIIREKVVTKLKKLLEKKDIIMERFDYDYEMSYLLSEFLMLFPETIEEGIISAKIKFMTPHISELDYNCQKLIETRKKIAKKLSSRIFPALPKEIQEYNKF